MIQSMTALAFAALASAETEAGPLTLRLSCQRSQYSNSARLELTLRNKGADDTAVVLGTALSNGRRYLPNGLVLTATWAGARDIEEFGYAHPEHSVVGGRLDPWVVPLPSRASYAITVDASDFLSRTTHMRLRISGRPAELRLRLEAGGPKDANSDMPAIRLLKVWTGTVASNRVRVPDECGGLVDVPEKVPPVQPRTRSNPPRPHMIGLVELPRVWESEGEAAEARRRLGARPLLVHDSPAGNAAVIARVTDPDELTAREHGYAHTSAVAYARERGWYRIRLRDDRYGWLSPQEAGLFRSTETLLLEALTHFTEHWDGRFADAPARSAPTRRAPRPANQSVDVRETRQVGDDLWLRIAILNPGHCDAVEPRVVAAGWIPAYAPSGDPTVWFYSRGC